MSIGRALRYIVEEPVRNPIPSAQQLEQELRESFSKELDAGIAIPIKTVFVFTHPAANLNIKDSPVPVCKVDKLKKHVTLNAARLDSAMYEKLASLLEQKTLA